MDTKNILSQSISRRDFFRLSLGAALMTLMPSSASATTLSEFKAKHASKSGASEVVHTIEQDDLAVIGEESLGIENIILRETNLSFGKLERRSKTDAVVIHHVGNTDKNLNAAAIHRWHRQNGWAGIGYHYIIRKDGTIERGRPLDMVGAHTYKQNDHTVGICVVGNFELARPTHAQFRAAEKLVNALCTLYDIEPNAKTVVGHRDYCKTDCPGLYLYKWLPDIIRNAV